MVTINNLHHFTHGSPLGFLFMVLLKTADKLANVLGDETVQKAIIASSPEGRIVIIATEAFGPIIAKAIGHELPPPPAEDAPPTPLS